MLGGLFGTLIAKNFVRYVATISVSRRLLVTVRERHANHASIRTETHSSR